MPKSGYHKNTNQE